MSSLAPLRRTDWRSLIAILLPAVTVAFGLQLWRALLSLLVAVLHNRFSWNAAMVGLVALAVLLSGLLAAPLQRWLGSRRTLALTAGGTGLLRLAMQVWTGDPLLELALALAGSVLFTLSLPTFAGTRPRNSQFPPAALLGLALELALHGFWRTYDLSWQSNLGALLITVALFLLQAGPLALELWGESQDSAGAPFPLTLAWLSLGPYFVLALLAWQNVARLTVMTGWSQATVYLWMAVGQTLTVAGVIWLTRRAPTNALAMAVAGLVLLLGSLLPPWPAGLWTVVGYLSGYAGAALALVALMRSLTTTDRRAGWGRVALAQTAAILLFILSLYLYHFRTGDPASASPFFSRLLPLLPATLLAISALSISWRARRLAPRCQLSWRPVLLAIALLPLPLYRLATVDRPAEQDGHFPLRVMTYNLHNGFDTSGHLGLEALATVIEAEEPDIVLLQEVSRGLIIYGATDMLAWLSDRLNMHAHFVPTADALWGLGTLSRVPFAEGGGAALPPDDLLIRRGVEWIVLDMGEDGRLTVVNNHFHHPQSDSHVRIAQAQAVAEAWQQESQVIVGGDLNARPDTPEIERFHRAGWLDVAGTSSPQPGYTFPSTAPYERIDYLWLSPDLTAADITVPSSTASDHLAVVTTILRAVAGP